MKRKICVVITARPSYSRVRTVLKAIEKHEQLELMLVVAASALLEKYGQVVDIIRNDGFKSIETVYSLVEGENLVTPVKTTALGMIELSSVFERLKPDVVLTVGDRYETIATAVAASYMNIPLAHIMGGEITGNIDEKVRHAVTKLSDLHFVATKEARGRVIRMGEYPDKVFMTGCPSIDIVRLALERTKDEKYDLFSRYSGVGNLLPAYKDYIIVMQHSVTSEINESGVQIRKIYEAIKGLPLQIFWLWPNVDAGSDLISRTIRSIREKNNPPNIYFLKNLPSEDFILFLNDAKCIIGNSSVAIREGSYIGVPAVNIGTRQIGRERGLNVVDVGYDSNEINKAVSDILASDKPRQCEHLYGDGYAGGMIADLLYETKLTFEKRLDY